MKQVRRTVGSEAEIYRNIEGRSTGKQEESNDKMEGEKEGKPKESWELYWRLP